MSKPSKEEKKAKKEKRRKEKALKAEKKRLKAEKRSKAAADGNGSGTPAAAEPPTPGGKVTSLPPPPPPPPLAGGRFGVSYLIEQPTEAEARGFAEEICLEQTVELPGVLVPEGSPGFKALGHIESLLPEPRPAGSPHVWRCVISYPDGAAGAELPQLLNVVFGNTGMKEGVMVADFFPSEACGSVLPGPRFGAAGLRSLLGAGSGALLMTALKPMGTTCVGLAEMAYCFARGGIDIVKDDHGLQDQPWARWEERVGACADAVRRANEETGRRCLYAPCLNAPADRLVQRAFHAKRLGAGAVLMIPGITGLDTVRQLASDASFGLPIIAHPALLGCMLGGGRRDLIRGFSHEVLLGTLMRLIGCDATIFPNFGGRFGFSEAECLEVARGCRREVPGVGTRVPAAVPSPGGGVSLDRVPALLEAYGEDVLLLIGGSLYGRGPDLEDNSRVFYGLAGREPFDRPPKKGPTGGGAPEAAAGGAHELPGDTPDGGGGRCKLVRREAGGFEWSGAPRTAYKQDGAGFAGVSRTELLGTRGEESPFHVRYFEVAPGGYSSLERHDHVHGVVVLRGRGVAQLETCAREVGFGDVVFTAPGRAHQFRCPPEEAEPLGFICVVAAQRDRPVAVSPEELVARCPQVPPWSAALLAQSTPADPHEGGACEWKPKAVREAEAAAAAAGEKSAKKAKKDRR